MDKAPDEVRAALARLARAPSFVADLDDVRGRARRRSVRRRLGGLGVGVAAALVAIASMALLYGESRTSPVHPPTTHTPSAPSIVVPPLGTRIPEGAILLHGNGAEILRSSDRTSTELGIDLIPFDLSPDGATAIGTDGRDLVSADITTGRRGVLVRPPLAWEVHAALFSPDGTSVAYLIGSSHPDRETVCAMTLGADPVRRCFPQAGQVYTLDWSPFGDELLVAGPTPVRLIDVGTGEVTDVVPRPAHSAIARVVAAAGYGQMNQLLDPIWSADDRYIAAMADLQGSRYAYVPVVFTPRGTFVALGRPSVDFPGPGLAWSPQGHLLMYAQALSIARTDRVFLLDPATGQEQVLVRPGTTEGRKINSFAWSPSGRWVAVGLDPIISSAGVQQSDPIVEILATASPAAPAQRFDAFDSGAPTVVVWGH
jgi:WD40 repeat protein